MAERPQRTNRNMIVLLAADTTRLAELNLPPQQAELVATNCVRTNEAVTVRIAQTYHWAFVPGQPDPARPAVLTVEKADGPGDRLAERVTEKLRRTGQLTGELVARSIRLDLDTNLGAVWGRGHVSVGDLWSYYCRYPYLTRLRISVEIHAERPDGFPDDKVRVTLENPRTLGFDQSAFEDS